MSIGEREGGLQLSKTGMGTDHPHTSVGHIEQAGAECVQSRKSFFGTGEDVVAEASADVAPVCFEAGLWQVGEELQEIGGKLFRSDGLNGSLVGTGFRQLRE